MKNKACFWKFFVVLAGLWLFSYHLPAKRQVFALVHQRATIHSEPSLNSPVLSIAEPGQRLEVLETSGKWVKVKLSAIQAGYIPLEKVSLEELPSGAKEKVSSKKSRLPLYIAGGVAIAASAYLLIKKTSLFHHGTATLHISSIPSDAAVYIDGEEKCRTPCTVSDIEAGSHKIKVVRELYGKWEQEMNLRGDREYEIEAELSPFLYEMDRCFGGYGYGPGQMLSPHDIAKDRDGNLYVADWQNSRLEKFSSVGTFISQMTLPIWPSGIAYSAYNNTLYVVGDDPNLRNLTLNLVENWAKNLGLDHPGKIGIDPSGNIFIADALHNRIVKTNPKGDFLEAWSMRSHPTPMDVEPLSDQLYIVTCHFYNDRVLVYSPDGVKEGEFSFDVNCATSVTTDRMGHVYVTGRDSHWEGWVYKALPDGTLALKFKRSASGDGYIDYPIALEVYDNGDLVILDINRNQACFWNLSEETLSPGSASIKALATASRSPGGRGEKKSHFLSPAQIHPKARKLRK